MDGSSTSQRTVYIMSPRLRSDKLFFFYMHGRKNLFKEDDEGDDGVHTVRCEI